MRQCRPNITIGKCAAVALLAMPVVGCDGLNKAIVIHRADETPLAPEYALMFSKYRNKPTPILPTGLYTGRMVKQSVMGDMTGDLTLFIDAQKNSFNQTIAIKSGQLIQGFTKFNIKTSGEFTKEGAVYYPTRVQGDLKHMKPFVLIPIDETHAYRIEPCDKDDEDSFPNCKNGEGVVVITKAQ